MGVGSWMPGISIKPLTDAENTESQIKVMMTGSEGDGYCQTCKRSGNLPLWDVPYGTRQLWVLKWGPYQSL